MSDAMRAETITIIGHGGDEVEAYFARPLDDRPRGGVVVIHHLPGYDEPTKEIVRTFAAHGYNAVCPNLFWRDAPGASPDDASAFVRAKGGVPDERVVGDVGAAASFLRGLDTANGKVGVIGYCSGGRHTVLSACTLDFDAAVDCYGAFVLSPPPESLKRMVPIRDRLAGLSCPLLGLFGADDQNPTPVEVAELEKELTALGKTVDFHTYEGAGHAFFSVNRTAYRPEAAVDGWNRIFAFYAEHLGA
jgi:carboxymethylenebutenolidase